MFAHTRTKNTTSDVSSQRLSHCLNRKYSKSSTQMCTNISQLFAILETCEIPANQIGFVRIISMSVLPTAATIILH